MSKIDEVSEIVGNSRVTWFVVAILFVALPVAAILVRSSQSVYNDMRAAPSFGLVAGHPIYQKEVTGPLFCVIYGPLSYLFYTPLFLLKGPSAVFLAGSCLSFLLYCLPLFHFLQRLRREAASSPAQMALLLFPFLLFTLYAAPLRISATAIRADAPALGFGGLACTILFFHDSSRRWRDPLLCALCSVLAVGSKQNMLPLVLALAVSAALVHGRVFCARYLLGLLSWGLLTIPVLTLLYGDLSAVVLNSWVAPSRIRLDWKMLPTAAHALYREFLPLLLAGGAALVILGTRTLKSIRPLPFLAAVIALLPPSLLGRVITGGGDNALAPALYFGLLTLVAGAYLAATGRPKVRPQLTALAGLFCLLLIPPLARNFQPSFVRQMLHPSSSQIVFEYARRHPGEIYFPFHQTSVFLAERRFYHGEWGVGDYLLANIPISKEQILRYIPSTARYVAYPADAPSDWLLPFLAPGRKMYAVSELSNFRVFEIER